MRFSDEAKAWAGWIDKKENLRLLRYKGYGLIALNYQSADERLWCSLILYPRNKFINFNTIVEFNYKLKNKTIHICLFSVIKAKAKIYLNTANINV